VTWFLVSSPTALFVVPELHSRTAYAKAIMDTVTNRTSLQLFPLAILRGHMTDKKLKLAWVGKDRQWVGSIEGQKSKFTVAGEWTNATETALQDHLVDMASLLNVAMESRTLFWDFSISGKPTLGSFKPDGHARLLGASHVLQVNNILQTAVLVELKATSSLCTDDTQGM